MRYAMATVALPVGRLAVPATIPRCLATGALFFLVDAARRGGIDTIAIAAPAHIFFHRRKDITHIVVVLRQPVPCRGKEEQARISSSSDWILLVFPLALAE